MRSGAQADIAIVRQSHAIRARCGVALQSYDLMRYGVGSNMYLTPWKVVFCVKSNHACPNSDFVIFPGEVIEGDFCPMKRFLLINPKYEVELIHEFHYLSGDRRR